MIQTWDLNYKNSVDKVKYDTDMEDTLPVISLVHTIQETLI